MEYQSEPYRIFCTDDAGKCVAEITFPETEAGVCCIDHTFVDDSLRGMGDSGKREASHCHVLLCGTLAGKAKRKRQKCIRILKSRLFYS